MIKDQKRTLWLVATLLIGVVSGLALGYFMAPSTEGLQKQVDELQGQIAEKNTEIHALQEQVNNLTNQVREMGNLQSELAQRDQELLGLQNELTQKDGQIQTLQEQISDLNQSYERLLNEYGILNAPVSTFVSAADLDFTITTHQRIYSYKDPVSGNVTIHYHNGTAFKGFFSILIEQVDGPGGSGWRSEVNGYGDFYVKPPAFLYGPGTYRIGLCTLGFRRIYGCNLSRDRTHLRYS